MREGGHEGRGDPGATAAAAVTVSGPRRGDDDDEKEEEEIDPLKSPASIHTGESVYLHTCRICVMS